MNNNIWAIVFLIAGTLLSITAVTTMVPAAYADNEVEAALYPIGKLIKK